MAEIAQRCSFAIGDVIDNRYRVCKMLGEGSFGKVYAVKDSSGQSYAVKLLKLWEVPPEIRDSLAARFDMEFETGRIESNYLVHSLSHGIVMGNPYIVMEYCPNGDLLYLSQNTSVDYTKAATHILYGLKALHICGKVHRDLKPENVLVKQNGNFALTDFGISGDRTKRMTERNILGKPKQIFGTYAYMPPEQLRPFKDATVLPTTDIFSFGVMMFQLLTGELPFGPLCTESDLPTYTRRGKSGDWDRELLNDNASRREWTSLIEGCLVPDYQQRLQSADDVLALVPHGYIYTDQTDVGPQNFQTRIVNGVLLRGTRNILNVGRRDEGVHNDISIREDNSSYVSRKHCTLELDYDIGSWVIRDGQWDKYESRGWRRSTNGTYVNSTEVGIEGLVFKPGDIISIGDTKLRAEAY
jgi:serine/threonine protein kinase